MTVELMLFFFFQAEDGIRDLTVTGVQTCALPISLTQQLIKNDFLTADRTLSRKLKEAAMAIILESRLSKQEIFTLYCNDVYLGQSGTFAINGFAQAAQVYFDKDLGDLSLGETAFL